MAKQYKKLQNKVHPKPKADSRAKEKEKIGKDYLLLTICCFTLIVTLFGWEQFDMTNRAMYVLLTFSLMCTYVGRHANVSENAKIYINRASLASMGIAIAMFLLSVYNQFFG